MKKIYMIAATLLVANAGISQDSGDTLTFESIILDVDTFYNGADGAGEIQIGNFNLTNYYNTQSGYSESFSVSNVSDVTTPDYTNQFASFTGGGSNSSNYGIYYSYGTISFPNEYLVSHLEVTNTTFAALSMRDGDDYGKQFGSVNDAHGNPDGTNGEDFFVLKIIPLNDADELIGDTIEFYLADYRFADNSQDYIIDEWTNIVFPNGGITANKLKFELISSDTGDFGNNTPSYFALDNLVASSTAGLKNKEINWSMYPNPTTGDLFVNSELDGEIFISSSLGANVFSGNIGDSKTINMSNFPAGVYFVTLNTNKHSTVQKLIKK